MSDWSTLTLEPMVAASPIWIRVSDAFTGRPPAGPITVALERRRGADWIVFEHRHQLSRAGNLAFVNLGRAREPFGTFDVRVTVDAPGSIPEAAGGDGTIVATVASWSPDAPGAATQPQELRLFPGPSYAFPLGTPLLSGRVVDSNGDPASRARIWATATVQNTPRVEEARSDSDGRFRLPLRWSAGATDIHATHGAESGSITVFLPADLSSTHQITLT
jgi:Carboxypeptidase regulatory-like domain